MSDEKIFDGSEPVIYVGPDSFQLMLKKFQVFTGGLPLFVQRAIEQIPDIQKLIVPIEELENMRAKIAKSGTYEARIFYNVQKEIDKIREKRK